jgi:UDP-N-acetylglucosamine 4,6-dehydratase
VTSDGTHDQRGELIQGRAILVTGGTGSFGTAFVTRCLAAGARRVVVYSRDELKQSELQARLESARLRCFIGDVRDPERLARAMRGVDVVVHAAAMKRIDTCEANPEEAVRTNVLGTLNVAKVAIDAGVQQAVLLSTDKAPNAATLYGATKMCAERLWCQSNVYAAGRVTRLNAVRYGNVIGSRGSVLDLFRAQRARREPLTITSESMTRFFMTVGDAVDLVLVALRTMRGGEVIVPQVGSASVLMFARAVVEGPAGEPYAPGHVVTGPRATERMHETLISSDESSRTYDAGDQYIIEPDARVWAEIPPPAHPRVADGFAYRSDTNPRQLSLAALRAMVARC